MNNIKSRIREIAQAGHALCVMNRYPNGEINPEYYLVRNLYIDELLASGYFDDMQVDWGIGVNSIHSIFDVLECSLDVNVNYVPVSALTERMCVKMVRTVILWCE